MSMISHWLYLLAIFAGLAVSLRHIRLSPFSPAPAVGFGLVLAANFVTQLFQLAYMRSGTPLSSIPYPQIWGTVFTISSFIGLAGWTLIVGGLYFIFNDVSQRLALLQLAPQEGWKNLYNSEQAYNRQAYHAQNQTPTQVPNQPVPNQEVNHASAFVSSPIPNPAQNGTALPVRPEPAEDTLSLGSSRQ